jgi:hypothetical protein
MNPSSRAPAYLDSPDVVPSTTKPDKLRLRGQLTLPCFTFPANSAYKIYLMIRSDLRKCNLTISHLPFRQEHLFLHADFGESKIPSQAFSCAQCKVVGVGRRWARTWDDDPDIQPSNYLIPRSGSINTEYKGQEIEMGERERFIGVGICHW